MPKRLKNQVQAKKRREEKREHFKAMGFLGKKGERKKASSEKLTKSQINIKTYQLILLKGPDYFYDIPPWARIIGIYVDIGFDELKKMIEKAKEGERQILATDEDENKLLKLRNQITAGVHNSISLTNLVVEEGK